MSKTVSEYINLGEDYDKVRKVYSINIVYFELGQGKDYVYHGRNEFRGIHDGDLLQLSRRQQEIFKCKYASDIFPNKVAKTPLDEWMSFLKTGRIEATATAQGLPEARERLRVDSMPEAERRAYIRGVEAEVYQRSVLFSSWDDGRQEGLKEGKKEATIEMARNLKQLGVPIETIIKSSGLTEAEIAQL